MMHTFEFRDALAALGLTAYSAGPVLGVSRRQVYRYAAGASIPAPVARVLRSELDRCRVRGTTLRDGRTAWAAYRDGRLLGFYETQGQAQRFALNLPR
jgi:hypothetical protein